MVGVWLLQGAHCRCVSHVSLSLFRFLQTHEVIERHFDFTEIVVREAALMLVIIMNLSRRQNLIPRFIPAIIIQICICHCLQVLLSSQRR